MEPDKVRIQRAIYTGDVRFDVCNVFELNHGTNQFEMLNEPEITYDKDIMYADDDFLVFNIEGELVTQVNK